MKSEEAEREGKVADTVHGAEEKVDHQPLLVEIEAEAGEDESEERHQDGDGHRAAVGTELGGRRVLTLGHVQTCRGKI